MSKRFPIAVGQTVYVVGTGNAQSKRGDYLIECVVDKIGRQYFYVKSDRLFWGRGIAKFSLEDFTCYDSNNNYGYKIYESKEQYQEETECREKREKILKALNFRNEIRLETIRAIYDLLVSDGVIA